jgi:hypothetical protein
VRRCRCVLVQHDHQVIVRAAGRSGAVQRPEETDVSGAARRAQSCATDPREAAGEIGPAGHRDAGISGASFPASTFTAACSRIDRRQQFDSARTQSPTRDLMQRLESLAPGSDAERTFALVGGSAGAEHRTIQEIDGEPAAQAYARPVGTDVAHPDPLSFAEQPMVVIDGSLTLFCAIEEGLVLRVARGADLAANLADTFAGIAIGQPAGD